MHTRLVRLVVSPANCISCAIRQIFEGKWLRDSTLVVHKSGLEVAFPQTSVIVIWAMKVLIAEDDRDSRELLAWMLQKLGYQVVATSNGKEAWDAFRRGRFRLVISDVLMPEIDGLELCRRIRTHKQSKYTYIIVITALIGKKDYLEGMEAGADDFVTKPFDPDELKARLRVAERIISFQEQTALREEAFTTDVERQREGRCPTRWRCLFVGGQAGDVFTENQVWMWSVPSYV